MVGGNENNSYFAAVAADITGQVWAEFKTCPPQSRQKDLSYVRIDKRKEVIKKGFEVKQFDCMKPSQVYARFTKTWRGNRTYTAAAARRL